jgi:DNA-binding PadR family transcriptional regulator
MAGRLLAGAGRSPGRGTARDFPLGSIRLAAGSYTDGNMSETHDKRRKSDLDLFVLALINSGVSTPYTLQKEAGLSPGATIPAIQRLLQGGLIRQGKAGVRGRTESRITAAGRKQLRSGWRILIEEGPSGDLDADLRVALLAMSEGNAYSSAVQILNRSAAKLLEMGQAVSRDKSDAPVALAGVYRELRSLSVKALLEGQAAAATTIAERLPRKLSMKRKDAGSSSPNKAPLTRIKRLK